MKSLLFLFSLSLFASSNTNLIQAINLLKSGKTQEGFQLLEKSFSLNISKPEKAKMALLLAQANPKELQRSRKNYAVFAINNHPRLKSKNSGSSSDSQLTQHAL